MANLYIPVPEAIVKPDGLMTRAFQLFLQKLVQTVGSSAVGTVFKSPAFTIAHDDILTLPTTPITFGTLPGPGFFASPVRALVTLRNFVGYTNIDTDAWLNIHTLDWQADTLSYLLNGNGTASTRLSVFFGNVQSATWIVLPFANGSAAAGTQFDTDWGFTTDLINDADAENQPFEISMDNGGSGNLTGGDPGNSMSVTVYYTIEAI